MFFFFFVWIYLPGIAVTMLWGIWRDGTEALRNSPCAVGDKALSLVYDACYLNALGHLWAGIFLPVTIVTNTIPMLICLSYGR